MEFKIRQVQSDDLHIVLGIDVIYYGNMALSVIFLKECYYLFNDTFLVITDTQNRIAGFCIGITSNDNKKGWISALTILKEYSGKGAGKKLITEVINRLKSLGVETVSLTVDPNSKAFQLYKNVGFKIVGELKEDYYGKDQDRFLMEIKL